MEIHLQTTDHVVAVEKVAEQHISVTIESKYGNRVPKRKIQRKPDSFELVYTKL